MICLRSGYCCINYDVMIVDDLSKGIIKDNIVHKSSGVECKHLKFNGLEAECLAHNEDWYKETPCFEFTQIESKNTNCRVGELKLRGGYGNSETGVWKKI